MRFFALIAACLCTACGSFVAPLPNSCDSPEALARSLLDALQRRDVQSLTNLALNETEFQEHVWPELPAARPERNLPFSYVWGDLHQKSNAALAETLARHGGRRYGFVGIRFKGRTTSYKTYRVHRGSQVAVRDEQGGEQTIRLFGSVLEKGGRFKVFSYVIDD